MNNAEKLIFQVSAGQSRILIENNTKGRGGERGLGVLPGPQPDNYM